MIKTDEYPSSNLNKYQCQHPFASERIDRFYDSLVKLIGLVKPACILNIGCGEGFDTKIICEKRRVDSAYFCGLDLNSEALKMAQDLLTTVRFDAIQGDIYHLPFSLSRFDIVLCLEVLEHLEYPVFMSTENKAIC